jgi:hypothetical protein
MSRSRKNTAHRALAVLNIKDEGRTHSPPPLSRTAPMPASEARILANQTNSQRSTGPRTTEGKERSRANALKHGMTGAGVVLPEADAAEVDRRAAAFATETHASGEVGHALARLAALSSVRMERGADQQNAALAEHVRRVEADFVTPEGVDQAEADQLRSEAVRRAMFDPSHEATLARNYEAAAERGFFRALKELRRLEEQAKAVRPGVDQEAIKKSLASFFQAEERMKKQVAKSDAMCPEPPLMPASRPSTRLEPLEPLDLSPERGGIDVPFSIGRRR